MSFAAPHHLLDWYGAKEMAQIATPDDLALVSAQLLRLTLAEEDRSGFSEEETTAADAALNRMTIALEESSQLIESYLGHRFSLPIAPEMVQSSPLPRACGAMARRLLYDDGVPPEVEQRYTLTLSWLRDLASGQAHLGSSLTTQGGVGAGLVDFEAGSPVFDRPTLNQFISR
ncbi:MAG: DUF1320 family protein [Magnetococcales bacterium]|nr:DUF1320 family protein [Magnetococcales bacterium]